MLARVATADDDLTRLWPSIDLVGCNRDQVFVAERNKELIGGVTVWDGGHKAFYLDDFVNPDKNPLVWMSLYRFMLKWASERGAQASVWVTANEMLRDFALRLGGQDLGLQFRKLIVPLKMRGSDGER